MEVTKVIEDIINESAEKCDAPFLVKLVDNVAFLDSIEYTSDSKEYIIGLKSSPQGSYLPLSGVNLEQMSAMMTFYVPLRLKNEFFTVLKEAKKSIVGHYRKDDSGEFCCLNMDTPLVVSLDYKSLNDSISGVPSEKTEEYVQISIQFYYLLGSGIITGNDLQISIDGYELKTTSSTMSFSNEYQPVQSKNETSTSAIYGKSHIQIRCLALFESNATLQKLLSNCLAEQYPTYNMVISLSESELCNFKVIVANATLDANKGSVAMLNLTFVKGI